MKIIILDPYKNNFNKINKDQAGGYGTSNSFGNGLLNKGLSLLVKKLINYPPMFAMYSASVLEKKGFDVEYVQNYSQNLNADIFLVASSIVCHETEIKNINKLKDNGKYVGVIGSFCSTLPDPYLEVADFVIKGEPEFYFLNNNLETLKAKELKGLIKVDGNTNVNDLPYPSWEKFFKFGGPRAFFISKFKKTIPIIANRGCPYSCFNYCTYPTQQGRVVRFRSIENIIEEIKYWKNKYNINNFLFRDPVFSINNKKTLELCDKIKDENLRINYGIETHLNNLNKDIGKKLYDSGLRYIEVGIESVTEDVIKASKRFSIKKSEEIRKVKELEDIGIKVKTMFIFGLPKDTVETCLASIKFAKEIDASYSQFNLFTPYPGTPIFLSYEKNITSRKYEDFTQSDLVFNHEILNQNDFKKLINKSYLSYYFRPKYFIKTIKGLFN